MIPLLIITALTHVFLSPEYGEPGLGGCTAVIETDVLVVYDLSTGEYLSEIRPGNGMDDPLLLLRSIDWTG